MLGVVGVDVLLYGVEVTLEVLSLGQGQETLGPVHPLIPLLGEIFEAELPFYLGLLLGEHQTQLLDCLRLGPPDLVNQLPVLLLDLFCHLHLLLAHLILYFRGYNLHPDLLVQPFDLVQANDYRLRHRGRLFHHLLVSLDGVVLVLPE